MSLLTFFLDFLLNPWFLISLVFWLIIGILAYLFREKKEAIYVFFPLLAMLKTKRLNNFIKKISKKYPRTWRIFWSVGIFVSFGLTIFGFYFFFINLMSLIVDPKVQNVVTPLIPGVTINIPIFMYLLLPLLFIMTTHELAHGIAATIDDVDVKSTGILGAGVFFLIGFGAFVEVDEREMASKKVERKTRLRIAAAGTFINIITAGVAMIIILNFSFLISPFYGPQVVQIDTVLEKDEGGFNYNVLDSGDVILGLKKQGSNADFLKLNYGENKTLENYLYNKTNDITCSVGDNLTLEIYNPSDESNTEKDIRLGPHYNIGIRYEYISNDELKITEIYSKEAGGNNYDSDIKEEMIITKINGTNINVDKGDTLEYLLTKNGLKEIMLTDDEGENYYLDAELDGVVIGILSKSYWMPLNFLSKIFTGEFPNFLLREFIWLWIIAFSISLFNMLPLPIFDGDRVIKELINWGIGEEYEGTKTKKETMLYESEEKVYELSEYRVENIKRIKLTLNSENNNKDKLFGKADSFEQKNSSEIIIGNKNFELIDSIDDGFDDAIKLKFHNKNIPKNSILEIEYDYSHDKKRRRKKIILNSLRVITLAIVAGNFILSFLKFGVITFWV